MKILLVAGYKKDNRTSMIKFGFAVSLFNQGI